MDLNDIWQNHKRFLLGIGGGLLAFLIGSVIIDSTWDVSTVSAGIAKRAREIRGTEAPSSNDLAALVADCDRLKARLDTLYQRMNFVTRPDYVIPGTESADLFYNRRRDEAQDRLVRDARRLNITVKPSLGLPDFTPSGSEAIQRYLRALDVVDRVVSAAVDSRVRAVDDIEVRDTKPSSRSKAGSFLDVLAVKFTISGGTSSIAALIDRLTAADRDFLAIEEAEIATDPRRNHITVARLTVAAIGIVDAEAGAETRK